MRWIHKLINGVSASAVEWYDPPGYLSKMGIDETLIPEESRIPRFTSASWSVVTDVRKAQLTLTLTAGNMSMGPLDQ